MSKSVASNLFTLDGTVAVVIGGTGGLGGAMANALASHGAFVAVIAATKNEANSGLLKSKAWADEPFFKLPMRWTRFRCSKHARRLNPKRARLRHWSMQLVETA